MEQNNKEIAKSLLIGLGVLGAAVVVGAVAPGLFGIFRQKRFIKNKYTGKNFNHRINYLKGKKFIQIKTNSDNSNTIELTEKGRRRVLKYNLEDMRIKPMAEWDKKWRFVMFDIPDRYRKASNALREKLKELEFFQFQKSIWIHPYPIKDEIEFVSAIFNIRRFVKMGEITDLEDDGWIRTKFRL